MHPQTSVSSHASCVRKILVVGDSNTGKTTMIRRSVHGVFKADTRATLGVDFSLRSLDRPDGAHMLQLWDIAGQEKSLLLSRRYYQGGVGALVACDITRPDSFDVAAHWKADIDSKVFLGPEGSPTKIPCILLVNKCDLGPLHMSTAELDAFCQQHGFVAWFQTSAKTGVNVDEPFDAIADYVTSALRDTEGQAPVPPGPFPDPKKKRNKADKKKDDCSC